ncbi:MAG: hypothetical protein P8Y99_18100 [Calditrichaceae bacterium]
MTHLKLFSPFPSCIILFVLLNIMIVQSQDTVNKVDVLEKMTLANDYFTNKWPDPTIMAKPGLWLLFLINWEERFTIC